MLPSFPQFTKLKSEDKEIYNRAIADYPPFSDILFSTLHIWWNQLEQLEVALLNDNVVIKYKLQFDDDNSGYCLVGTNEVDASITAIFEYLKSKDLPLQLVHVPEFVIEAIGRKEDYDIQEEPDYHEYILGAEQLARLEGSSHGHIRTQINRFRREVEGKKLEHKQLDLSVIENQDHILQAIREWEKAHPPRNDPDRNEHEALKQTLSRAAALDIESLALYIDDRLHGVILYHQTHSKDHYVIHHLRFDYTVPYTSDYLTHQLANQAMASNVPYINMEMDLGIENLRRHKTKLRPVKLFKKYRLRPR